VKLSRSVHAVAAAALVAFSVGMGATASSATTPHSHTQIQGSGSTWASNAVNQWISDVTSQGIQVVFSGVGSGQGRSDFAEGLTDFGVTDIGYQGIDPGCEPGRGCRAFAYAPIVAGGTSFPYHILVAGKLVQNLRLSGETLSKIFTYQITNWDNPEITADNNGHALPSLPIIPVTHSEPSGTSAQFTMYMNAEYPSIWQPFAEKYAHTKGFVEYYPLPSGGQTGVAQNGSDGVMNFVSSAAANGAIGFDEYSYPLAQSYPVVALLNKAGYYTEPTQYNVAVALQHAQINMDKSSPDYLLETLNDVYTAPEPQAYAMSSYSYFLIPTAANDVRMTTAKRQTLADFLQYSVCQGQKEMGPIGYSPLPSNLVLASFAQTALLGKADPNVDVSAEKNTSLASCGNPTFFAGNLKVNRLAQIAPLPPACAKQGAGPCTNNADASGTPAGGGSSQTGGGGTRAGGGSQSGDGGSQGGSGSTQGHGGGTPLGGGSSSGGGGSGGSGGSGTITPVDSSGTAANNPSTSSADPFTGSGVSDSGDGADGDGADGGAEPQPSNLAAYRSPNLTGVLAPLAVVLVLAVLVVPPLMYVLVIRRRKQGL
jgi:phosphate transport system substrate-binding protein